MKIELRKVKLFLAGSQETICFVAEVMVDGVLLGTARNEGHGGSTSITEVADHKLLEKVQNYLKSVPKHKFGADENSKAYEVTMTLAVKIDLLIDEELVKADMKRAETKMKKYLLFTKLPASENFLKEYYTLSAGKFTIEQMLSRPDGIKWIKDAITAQAKQGLRLVSTNIPKHIIDEVNLPKPVPNG